MIPDFYYVSMLKTTYRILLNMISPPLLFIQHTPWPFSSHLCHICWHPSFSSSFAHHINTKSYIARFPLWVSLWFVTLNFTWPWSCRFAHCSLLFVCSLFAVFHIDMLSMASWRLAHHVQGRASRDHQVVPFLLRSVKLPEDCSFVSETAQLETVSAWCFMENGKCVIVPW